MAKLWSAWLDSVVPEVPGAPASLITYHIKRAAIDFCDSSEALRKSMAAIDSVLNQGEYTLPDVATGVMVSKLLEVRWLGTALIMKRPDELALLYSPVDWRAQIGTPQFFTQETSGVLRLVPAPNVATVGAINGLWVAARPKDDALSIDDAFGSDWHDAIAMGAKRNLMAIPGKPYSNLQQAALYATGFNAEVGAAAYAAFRGSGPSTSRTQTSYR